MRALMGAVNARELRSVQLTEAAFDALVDGLSHSNPQLRWWSVQLLDHCPDPRAVDAIAPLLDDPVPRVRRNAAHALGCMACKPAWSGKLAESVIDRFSAMAQLDPNPKVRAEDDGAVLPTKPALTTRVSGAGRRRRGSCEVGEQGDHRFGYEIADAAKAVSAELLADRS